MFGEEVVVIEMKPVEEKPVEEPVKKRGVGFADAPQESKAEDSNEVCMAATS